MDAKSCVLRRLLTYLMRKLGQSRESCWPTISSRLVLHDAEERVKIHFFAIKFPQICWKAEISPGQSEEGGGSICVKRGKHMKKPMIGKHTEKCFRWNNFEHMFQLKQFWKLSNTVNWCNSVFWTPRQICIFQPISSSS